MTLDIPHMIEYGVELGYGIIYLILAITTIMKYKETENKLALYFFIGFLLLSITGFYGGISGFLNQTGFGMIPILGNKVNEIYNGMTTIALGAFLIGLYKI